MTYFARLKTRFMNYFTLLRWWKLQRKYRLAAKQEQSDARLTNFLYWPKGNTTSCNVQHRYGPKFQLPKQNVSKNYISEHLSKTKRTP